MANQAIELAKQFDKFDEKKEAGVSLYAKRHYNITSNLGHAIGVSYIGALLTIAGADGELAEDEINWLIEEQRLFSSAPKEVLDQLAEFIRKFDWRSADLDSLLKDLKYDFPINIKHKLIYQAIKMSHADRNYHKKELKAVWKAAGTLGVPKDIVIALENLVNIESSLDKMRHALLGTA